jgi:ssRNA-specific RNase YbeY (16S rRNA maturation enzyme)
LSVSVQNCQWGVRVSLPRLRALGQLALTALGRGDREIHVSIVDDRSIRRLHARYLGSRRATDVIAFNLEGPASSPLLGEIVISAETVGNGWTRSPGFVDKTVYNLASCRPFRA